MSHSNSIAKSAQEREVRKRRRLRKRRRRKKKRKRKTINQRRSPDVKMFVAELKKYSHEEEFEKYDIREDNISFLASGAYGDIFEIKSLGLVIKKVLFFRNLEWMKRLFREIRILRFLSEHRFQGVARLLSMIRPKDSITVNKAYMVFKKRNGDLHDVIHEEPLTKIQIKKIMYKLLTTLHSLHHSKILHRDLKPSNIIITLRPSLIVEICDYGCAVSQLSSKIIWKDVMSLSFRPPELLHPPDNRSYTYSFSSKDHHRCTRRRQQLFLGLDSKASKQGIDEYINQVMTREVQAVDIWALGCIFAELLTKRPLFPGKDEQAVLFRIHSLIQHHNVLEDLMLQKNDQLLSLGGNQDSDEKKIDSAIIRKLYPYISIEAEDLLLKMLCYQPMMRISAKEAVEHPYFDELRKKVEEEERRRRRSDDSCFCCEEDRCVNIANCMSRSRRSTTSTTVEVQQEQFISQKKEEKPKFEFGPLRRGKTRRRRRRKNISSGEEVEEVEDVGEEGEVEEQEKEDENDYFKDFGVLDIVGLVTDQIREISQCKFWEEEWRVRRNAM